MPRQGDAAAAMDAVTWWRWANQRDMATFVDSHGRRPNSWLEFSRWITPESLRRESHKETPDRGSA